MSATAEKIVLKIKDTEIALSVDDAKALHKALGELVADKVIINRELAAHLQRIPCPPDIAATPLLGNHMGRHVCVCDVSVR